MPDQQPTPTAPGTTTASATPAVVTRATPYAAVVAAMSGAQKTSKGAPAYSLYVNRPLGKRIAAGAYKLGMTPNGVTAVSALFSFAAIALLAIAPPSWVQGVLVAVGLVLGYAFDAADGQLARLRGGGSKSGEWLDHVIDCAKISCLHLAVLIWSYRWEVPPSAGWLLVPIGFTAVAAVLFFAMTLNDQLRRQHSAAGGVRVWAASGSTLRSLLVIPTDYGLLCVVFVLLGVPQVFFWVYAALFAASAGFLLLASVKWFRDMQALDTAASGSSPAPRIR